MTTTRYRATAPDGQDAFFSGLHVDSASPAPIYYQLEEHVRDKIEGGLLAAGSRLPAERDIAAYLGVSRMTVRQALTRLASDGLLAARRGGGTFVARPRVKSDLALLRSFSHEATRQGRRMSSRLLDVATIAPDRLLQRVLQIAPHRDAAIRVQRVRILDGEPVSIQTSFLPTYLCRPLLSCDLESASLYALLRSDCGLELARGEEELSATILDRWEAESLGTAPGSPAFLLERTTFDRADRPVEFVKSVLRGDRTTFHTSLKHQEVEG